VAREADQRLRNAVSQLERPQPELVTHTAR
jgi:hypothetical protein